MVVPHVLGDVVTNRQGELGVAPAVLLHPAQVADVALEAAVYWQMVRSPVCSNGRGNTALSQALRLSNCLVTSRPLLHSLIAEVAFADEVVVVAGGGELLGEDREVQREEVGAGVGLDVGDVDRVAPRADGRRRLASGVGLGVGWSGRQRTGRSGGWGCSSGRRSDGRGAATPPSARRCAASAPRGCGCAAPAARGETTVKARGRGVHTVS